MSERNGFSIGLFLSLGVLAQPASALIDFGDHDGMSNVWEAEYGFSITDNGTLIPAQAPAADADGDGRTNLEECKAGTDPWDGKATAGLFQADFGPDPLDPTKTGVIWFGVTGKLYRVFMSPDLGASWLQLGDPRIGTGGNIFQGIQGSVSAGALSFFYRVQAYDVDSDVDGLNDYEEFLLGTNPENGNEDPDHDHLSNLKERLLGTNPLSADTDGDGISDDAEEEFGLDPLDPDSDDDGTPDGEESIEPRWIGAMREINDYNGGGYDLDPHDGVIGETEYGGDIDMYGRWPDGPHKYFSLYLPTSYPELSPLLSDAEEGIPWPETLLDPYEEENIFSAGGTAITYTPPSFVWPSGPPYPIAGPPFTSFFAILEHRRNAVRIARPADRDLVFRSIIRKQRTKNSAASPDEFEERIVTIPQGERESDTLDLVPSFDEGGLATADYIEIANHDQIRLIVEEVSFSGDHYHELKSDVGGNAYSAPQWVDKNQDGVARTYKIDGKIQPGSVADEKNYPIAFTRSTLAHPSYAKVKGRFKITNLKAGETVRIRAKATDHSSDPLPAEDPGLELPEKEITTIGDDIFIYPETESSSPLNSSIQFYNAVNETAFEIKWEVKVGSDTTWRELAITKHTVFLTLKDPPPGLRSGAGKGFRETTFWLACANAKGDDGNNIKDLVENKIYKGSHGFKSRAILRFSHNFGSPVGLPLQYWGDDYVHGYPIETGAGVCRHWSDFMIDVLAVHDIPGSVYGVMPKGTASTNPHSVTPDAFLGIASEFILKPVIIRPEGENVELDPATNEPPMFNTIVPAQGRFDTDATWSGHVIVKVPIGQLEILYDPSYGTGPFDAGLLEYNNSMSGFYDSGRNRLWRPDGFLELKNYIPPP